MRDYLIVALRCEVIAPGRQHTRVIQLYGLYILLRYEKKKNMPGVLRKISEVIGRNFESSYASIYIRADTYNKSFVLLHIYVKTQLARVRVCFIISFYASRFDKSRVFVCIRGERLFSTYKFRGFR